MNELLLVSYLFLFGWCEFLLQVERIFVAVSHSVGLKLIAVSTYTIFGLKAPRHARTLCSQPSATNVITSNCAEGTSFIMLTHKDIPSLIDCLVKIEKGMLTR